MEIQKLARQALDRITGLDADLQCNLGASVLKELRDRAAGPKADLIDRAFGVIAKFPHYARPRAAVVLKTLQSLAGDPA